MLRVLVVEDDGDTAASCAMLLRLWGHAVEVAAAGPSALQAVQANQPDVVLLDLAIPKMDGWQVAKQLRQSCNGKRPLLIAVSGYGTEADRRRSQESGIDLHLTKPVDPAELEDLLKRFQMSVYERGAESACQPTATSASPVSPTNAPAPIAKACHPE